MNGTQASSSAPSSNIRFRLPGRSEFRRYVPEDFVAQAGPAPIPGASTAAAVPPENPQESRALNAALLSALQLERLVVLCGSGTSLGANGPLMRELWDEVANDASAGSVFELVHHDATTTDVEELLSRCDAYLQLQETPEVDAFRKRAIKKILERCRKIDPNKLDSHKEFLRRLARRRARDTRLKLFTTNYDVCFDLAASAMGLVAIDGFSFAQPRRFDARFFDYDIVRRSRASDPADFIPGVFQYFKLHGSVDWKRDAHGLVADPLVEAPDACLVYPARTKYQRSFEQPHLELMAQYLGALRQNNCCLLVLGFGFNDAHLTAPILSALESNPHFHLVIVDPSGEQKFKDAPSRHSGWHTLTELARRGHDITIVAATFDQFVTLIPDLRALTSAESLERAVRAVDRR